MPYSGVVVVDMIVPCFGNKSLTVLMLVVPTPEYNKEVPVIIGTNIIHGIKESLSNADKEWETAFDAIQSDSVGVVKATRKVTVQPNEAKTITCLVRNSGNIEAALTEPTEKTISARVAVCPGVVRVDKPGKKARKPVRVCNISAKIVTLHAQAEVCILEAI